LDATVAIPLLGLVAVLLVGGIGVYLLKNTERWARVRERDAARFARAQEINAARQRAMEAGVEVGLPPAVALEWSVEAITKAGYALQNRTENSVTFARDEGANVALGCFLMLFLFLPGLIYLLLANSTVRITITAYPTDTGSRLVIGGDNPQAVQTTIDYAHKLPKPGEWTPSPEQTSTQEIPASGTSGTPNLTEKLRVLAEAQEAGLITPEEFEAKKRNILDNL
jgi:hypothetical protein